jgi:hypothetical protein
MEPTRKGRTAEKYLEKKILNEARGTGCSSDDLRRMINNKSPMEILCRGPMFQVELKELLA